MSFDEKSYIQNKMFFTTKNNFINYLFKIEKISLTSISKLQVGISMPKEVSTLG